MIEIEDIAFENLLEDGFSIVAEEDTTETLKKKLKIYSQYFPFEIWLCFHA
jgi:hypothetical protein